LGFATASIDKSLSGGKLLLREFYYGVLCLDVGLFC